MDESLEHRFSQQLSGPYRFKVFFVKRSLSARLIACLMNAMNTISGGEYALEDTLEYAVED